MEYSGIKLYNYPYYEKDKVQPFDASRAYKSKFLKANAVFPVLSDDPVLQGLGRQLGETIAGLCTHLWP